MIRSRLFQLLLFSLALSPALQAQKIYTYVGDLGATYVLLAWGTTDQDNSIGRSSPSLGPATVRVGDVSVNVSDRNWALVENLRPDTQYPYEVTLNGRRVAGSTVRTWPEHSDRLCFLAIGDMGNGAPSQYRIADALNREFQRHATGDCPIRFVITLGDNVYGNVTLFGASRTGSSDKDWGPKFFEPYEPILAHVPFRPTLGNHDGNETESRGDLTAYLDNFYFPANRPARYYQFSYADFADFFSLDSTQNSENNRIRPAYLRGEAQSAWLSEVMPRSRAPWKVPYFHHPPFCAGPLHAGSFNDLSHFVDVFQRSGVKASFSGHEHNFQMSEVSDRTRGIRFFVSGAAGELRTNDVRGQMTRNAIAAWAPQLNFLSVDINKKEMTVTPMSSEDLRILDSNGRPVPMPARVRLP